MPNKFYIIFFLILILSSCGNHTKRQTTNQQHPTTSTSPQENTTEQAPKEKEDSKSDLPKTPSNESLKKQKLPKEPVSTHEANQANIAAQNGSSSKEKAQKDLKKFCDESFPIIDQDIPKSLFNFDDKPAPTMRRIHYLDYDFYFLMPISIKSDHYFVRGFSKNLNDKNKTNTLHIYKSKSDGGWRSSLSDFIFDKGICYAQGTKIVPTIENILDKCASLLSIDNNDPYKKNVQTKHKDYPFNDYFKLLDLRLKIQQVNYQQYYVTFENNQSHMNILPQYKYDIYIPFNKSHDEKEKIYNYFTKEKRLYLKNLLVAEQERIRPCMPNNFSHTVTQYRINHTLLGETEVFVYDKKCALNMVPGSPESTETTVRWHIAYQGKSGKAWIHQVESINDEKNIFPKSTIIATFKNLINVDLLALKPLEYRSQVMVAEELDTAFNEQNIALIDFDNTYIDITPITTRISPVREFLESR